MATTKIKLKMRDEQTAPTVEFEGEYRHLVYLLGVLFCCMAEDAGVHFLDILRDVGVSAAVIEHGAEEKENGKL